MKQPESAESAYWQEIVRQLDQGAKTVAAQLGPPPHAELFKNMDEFDMYMYELPPDKIDQHPFKERVIQLAQQGAIREAASLARFPYREILRTTGRPKIADQVKYSETMQRRAQARRAELAGEQPAEQTPAAEGAY